MLQLMALLAAIPPGHTHSASGVSHFRLFSSIGAGVAHGMPRLLKHLATACG